MKKNISLYQFKQYLLKSNHILFMSSISRLSLQQYVTPVFIIFLFCSMAATEQKIKNDKFFKLIKGLPKKELQSYEVLAISTGSQVKYSSNLNGTHHHYELDEENYENNCWQPQNIKVGQWIQVHSETPKFWTGLILQGREDLNEWVKQISVKYTLNGKKWIEMGSFSGNSDRNTKKKISFESPVYARVLRIYPEKWDQRPSLRFDATYFEMDEI